MKSYSKQSFVGFSISLVHVHKSSEICSFPGVISTHATVTLSASAHLPTSNNYNCPVIPLKHRPDYPSARTLFAKIMTEQDFGPIARELVREQKAADMKEAQDLIEAFVQWYATGSVTKTKSFVMFEGQVDQVFHTMILNSPWYMLFCHNFTGVYTKHEPIAEMGTSREDIADAAVYTTGLLESTWGIDLSQHLRYYVEAVQIGNYAAATVSCPSNDSLFDIVLK